MSLGHEVFLSEDYVAIDARSPKQIIEDKLREFDCIITVFHERWGLEPKNQQGEPLSITAIELETAIKIEKPFLILISNSKNKEEKLKKYLQRRTGDFEKGSWCKYYDDGMEFSSYILEASNEFEKKLQSEESDKFIKEYLTKTLEIQKENLTQNKLELEPSVKKRARFIEITKEIQDFDELPDASINSPTWKIEDFLKEKHWRQVIISSFGMGKTTYVQSITKDFAEKNLEYFKIHNRFDLFIPILIKLTDNSPELSHIEIYDEETIDVFLRKLSPHKNKKILLIIDRVGSYVRQDKMGNFLKKINELQKDFEPNLKVLMTTRPEKNILKKIHTSKNYVSLCQFDDGEIEQYFENFLRDTKSPFGYDDLESFNLKEEASRPLFCHMIAKIFSEPNVQRNLDYIWNDQMRRAWIYLQYVSSIKKHNIDTENKSLSPDQRSKLRKIAALNKFYSLRGLPKQENFRNDLINKLDVKHVENEEIEELSGYFSAHESLLDYLLAEFYIESISQEKIHLLNFIIPSEDSINFLGGLLDLLNTKNPITDEQNTLTGINKVLLGNKKSGKIEEFTTIAYDVINNSNILFPDDNFQKQQWQKIGVDYRNVNFTWLHYWFCFLILNKFQVMKNSTKKNEIEDKISDLLKISAHHVPRYLKNLQNTDLSDLDLSDVDLSGADLSGADLSRTDLTRANLSKTTTELSKVDKKENEIFFDPPCFEDAHMFHTDLEEAQLKGTTLSGAFLWQCDLAATDLEYAHLDYAILHYVRMNERTKLQNSIFEHTGGVNSPFNGADYDEEDENITEYENNMQKTFPPEDNLAFEELCPKLSGLEEGNVRYVGIVDQNRLIKYPRRFVNPPILTGKEKSILVHNAWLNWKLLSRIQKDFGEVQSSLLVFDVLKVIIMPFDQDQIILITTEHDGKHDEVIRTVKEHIGPVKFQFEHEDSSSLEIKTDDRGLDDTIKEICSDIRDVDSVDYLYVYTKEPKSVFQYEESGKYDKNNTWNHVNLVKDVWRRWRSRLRLQEVGIPLYVIVEYETKTTITSLIDDNNYLLFIAGKNLNYDKIIPLLLKLKSLSV